MKPDQTFLGCILLIVLSAENGTPKELQQLNNTKTEAVEDKSISRTLIKVQSASEQGRLILLVCKSKCSRQRNEIPKWIREFNIERNLTTTYPIGFHFHYYRQKFSHYGIEEKIRGQLVALVYIIANHPIHYGGDVNSKTEFLAWLGQLDEPEFFRVSGHTELDLLIGRSEPGNCIEDVNRTLMLLIHDPAKCPDPSFLKHITRSFNHDKNVVLVEMQRPLSPEAEVILVWRLPYLSHQCRMLILINNNAYVEIDNDISSAQLYDFAKKWRNSGNCSSPQPYAVQGSLSQIQIEYLSEERLIKNIEHNQIYMVVGIIGGIAVVALAISIFWGLNGQSFVKK